MLRTALAASLFLGLITPLKADKFYFDTAEDIAATEGNDKGRMIEGVLLSQTKDTYTIRIVGGQMEIAKSMVKRHVKDGLTVAQIETTEKGHSADLAKAETRRRDVQAAEASARRTEQPVAEPTEKPNLLIEIDFQNLLPGYSFRAYDPVLRRANLAGLRQVIEDFLRREIKIAAHR